MMRYRPSSLAFRFLAVASLCGCAMRGNVELLEARLRHQEDQLSRAETQLRSVEAELAAAERESMFLREQLAAKGEKTLLPEQADTLFRATGIQFNKLLTGGLDRDGVAGDELLSAVVVPHDADGELVKIPGEIEVQAYDLSREGEQKLIGSWRYEADNCPELWHSGFLGSGYLVRVPWTVSPKSGRIMLHAKLTTTDGRTFETSEPVDITPPPASGGVLQAGGKSLSGVSTGGAAVPEWVQPPVAPESELPGIETPSSLPKGLPDRAGDSTGRVRTSDSWTDETLPVYR